MGRKVAFLILILSLLIVLITACKGKEEADNSNNNVQYENNNGENVEDDQMDDIDIYDFYYINKAPRAVEKHSLDNLIKIYFSAKNIAVDIEEHEIYMDALYSRNGIDTFEDTIELNDKEGLINILEKYDIQKWKDDYTTEDPDSYEDGYGWLLLLQFEDGTVEKYRGTGPLKDEVIPDNFDAFGNELEDFINEQIDKNE